MMNPKNGCMNAKIQYEHKGSKNTSKPSYKAEKRKKERKREKRSARLSGRSKQLEAIIGLWLLLLILFLRLKLDILTRKLMSAAFILIRSSVAFLTDSASAS